MDFNPNRLVQARRRRGLTQTALAELVGVVPRTLRRWETGELEPDSQAVESLARHLKFAVSFFSRADPSTIEVEAVSFRSLSKARAADRQRAITGGELALEFSDWMDANFDLPAPDVPDLRQHRDEPEAAAVALRTMWGLGDKPISNMVALLESKGVRVFSLAEDCHEIDAFSMWQGSTPLIFLNTQKSSERSRFDAAHELAHLVLHKHGGVPNKTEERDANAFASAFLMPKTSVQEYAPRVLTIASLIRAKHIWNVSLAGLVYRLHKLGLITDWQQFALFRELSAAGYRTMEPESAPREQSQVFPQIFESLRAEGITKRDIAAQFGWDLDELNALVFNLILSPMQGGVQGASTPSPETRDKLRLMK